MSSMTLAAARAVVSYPLPGVFGTMNRRPVSGSSAGAEAPGSARSAVAPHPVVSSAAAATRAAPSLSRLNIIVPSPGALTGRGWRAEQAITSGRDDLAIVNRRCLLVAMMVVVVSMVALGLPRRLASMPQQ